MKRGGYIVCAWLAAMVASGGAPIYVPAQGYYWESTNGVMYHCSIATNGIITATTNINGTSGAFVIRCGGVNYQTPSQVRYAACRGCEGELTNTVSMLGTLYLSTNGFVYVDTATNRWSSYMLDGGTLSTEPME